MEKIKKVIAGSFGSSALAVDGDPPVVGIVKDYPAEFFPDPALRAAFLHEAKAWVDLGRHPNLLSAFSVGEREGGVRLVTEYLPPDELGINNLEGRLERRPPDQELTLRWAIEACRGMEYALSRGVVSHGDLRPANLYVGTDGTLRIGAWGMARALSLVDSLAGSLRLRGAQAALSFAGRKSFGTPSYMPPEQFDDATACGAPSDVYAFGIVLYQLVHHDLPFHAPLPQDSSKSEFERYWGEMRRLHRETEAVVPFDPLYTIITRCIEKDPARRFRSFQELRGELEALLGRACPPLSGAAADRAIVRGLGLLDARLFEHALPSFEQALALEAGNEAALRGKARTLIGLGRFEEALACAEKVLALLPGSAQAHILKGRALCGLGRPDEGLRCYDRALELDAGAGNALFRKGLALREKNRLDDALQSFERANALVPRQADYLREVGRTFQAMGLYKDAVDAHAKACEIMPLETRFWTDHGAALHNLDRLEEAIVCFDRALALDDANAAAWSHKGASLCKQGLLREGLACFEKAISLDPDDPAPWFASGVARNSLGESALAVTALQCFLSMVEGETGARVDSAREILELLGATTGLGLGASTPPEVAELVHNAIDFVAAGRTAEALTCYTKALEYDDSNGKVWALKAGLHFDLGQFEEAQAGCDRSLLLAANGADALCLKGRLLARGGDHAAALQCYDRAQVIQPKSSGMLLYKARALDALGRRTEAVRNLERLVALDGSGDKAQLAEALGLLKEWQAR